MTMPSYARKTSAVAGALLFVIGVFAKWDGTRLAAQQPPPKSVGRGWPVPGPSNQYTGYPEESLVGAVTPWYYTSNPTATGGKVPPGIQPLARDIFTSKDFYSDRDLWMDTRYYRCNSPIALDSSWGDYSSGPKSIDNNDPATAAWGHCERDYPRDAIVSPYPFKSAQAHYDALLAETRSHGGPTPHTKDTLPDWNGRYSTGLSLGMGRGRRAGGGGVLQRSRKVRDLSFPNRRPRAYRVQIRSDDTSGSDRQSTRRWRRRPRAGRTSVRAFQTCGDGYAAERRDGLRDA